MTNSFTNPSESRYLHDIRKTQVYSKKEEQELFKLCHKGNKTARAKLLSANMRFVLQVALQYNNCCIPLPDLVSEGSLGLIQAIERFDPSRGLKFITYAVWWVRAYITRALFRQSALIRIPTKWHTKINENDSTTNSNLKTEIRSLIKMTQRGFSIDAPADENGKTTLSDILADNRAAPPDISLESTNVESFIKDILNKLPKLEARVLKCLYGIDMESPQSLRKLGESLNLSHESIRQIRNRAFKRLRKGGLKAILLEKLEAQKDVSALSHNASGTYNAMSSMAA